jgi:hypothetical protein
MDSPDVPAFARTWPEDPGLLALVLAFDRGNYDKLRREGPIFVNQALERGDEQVAAHARELLSRIEPDPLGKKLFGIVFLLLALTIAAAYGGSIRP